MNKKNLGKIGENLAIKYLQKKGLKLLEKNFHSYFGEVDLICQEKEWLVLVEVKTRLDDSYGSPEEAVNQRKIDAILKTGQFYRLKNPGLSDSLRIDVVSIILAVGSLKPVSLKHFENVTKYM